MIRSNAQSCDVVDGLAFGSGAEVAPRLPMAGGFRLRWAGFTAALVVAALARSLPAFAQQVCTGSPEGRTCQVQQPLVNGALVDVAVQKDLGLIAIAGSCSGTLVNRSWVLTADHCVTSNGRIGGPAAALTSLEISAAWSQQKAIPTRIVRDWQPGHDVALLYLGAGDLGPANVQLFYADPVHAGQTITAYGRGRFALATGSGDTAVKSQRDGQYRSARFESSAANGNTISFKVNDAGQIVAGGDSGGPDIVTAPNGIGLGIAAVHSTCVPTFVAGKPTTGWDWVNGISSCTSAAIANIRDQLLGYTANQILWHNDATGETQIWFMSVSSRIGRATVLGENGSPAPIGPPWRIVGSRDFDGDKRADILWYNDATGEIQVWFMSGARESRRASVVGDDGAPVFIGPPWAIVAAGDMNADGRGDIVWHNASTGETQLWLMNGNKLTGRATVVDEKGAASFIGLPWSIVGIGDIDGDGKSDIVWHNASTSETQIWFMNVNRRTGRATVIAEGSGNNPMFVGPPWRIAEVNDCDGDGFADILWHNGSSGEVQIWLMDRSRIKQRRTVDADSDGGGALVGAPWRIMTN